MKTIEVIALILLQLLGMVSAAVLLIILIGIL